MELIKLAHQLSYPVKRSNLPLAEVIAKEMVSFIDEGNAGAFTGEWRQALALSHCQVEGAMPYRMFVLNADLFNSAKKRMTRAQNRKNWYFPSRIIFNAEVVKAEEKVTKNVPKREVIREGKEMRVELKRVPALISNIIEVDEACMSFANRSKRKMKRYHGLTVRYQVLRSFLGFKWLSTVTEEVEGLKAHIFQHEIDHSLGIDMYFGNGGDDDMRSTVRHYPTLQMSAMSSLTRDKNAADTMTNSMKTGYVDSDNKTVAE